MIDGKCQVKAYLITREEHPILLVFVGIVSGPQIVEAQEIGVLLEIISERFLERFHYKRCMDYVTYLLEPTAY